MAVETRTVSFYTCDSESCDYAVYREVDADGLPAGYHGAYSQVDGEGQARGIDWYACTWDHVPSAMSGALSDRGHAVENNEVPDHHTKAPDELPSGSGGLQGRRLDRAMSSYESSYDGVGGSEALRFGPDAQAQNEGVREEDNDPTENNTVGTDYSSGYSLG
jgi:hypothetical protein